MNFIKSNKKKNTKMLIIIYKFKYLKMVMEITHRLCVCVIHTEWMNEWMNEQSWEDYWLLITDYMMKTVVSNVI